MSAILSQKSVSNRAWRFAARFETLPRLWLVSDHERVGNEALRNSNTCCVGGGAWPPFVLGSKSFYGRLLTNIVSETRHGFKPSSKAVSNPFMLCVTNRLLSQ